MHPVKKIRVGILGVTGYTGQELLKILLRHPNSSVSYVGSRQVESSVPLGTILPSVRYAKDCQVSPLDFEQAARASDLLFLALPHGMAMQMVPALFQYNSKLKVIDLSGDFRLNSADSYEEAYHQPHTAHRFLKEAVYGLSEWERNSIRKSRLIANPGCYPTASLLGLLPLSEAGLLASEGLIIDAKSGITGAGRSAQEELLFSECFKTKASLPFVDRLELVGREVARVIEEFSPKALAIENLFIETNQKTAMRVAEVRGAILYQARILGLEIYEYTPLQVKVATTGYGKATKVQVITMVKKLVSGAGHLKQDDEMDAIAIGLTHFAYARPQNIHMK